MPKPFPKELRRSVIAVARQGEQSIARSFGISESCLSRWLKIADREDGISPDTAVTPSRVTSSDLETENRQLRCLAGQLPRQRGRRQLRLGALFAQVGAPDGDFADPLGQPPVHRLNSPPTSPAMRSLRQRTQTWWLGSEP